MQSSLSFCIYELNLAPCCKALRHLNTKELKTASMTRHFGIPQIHRSEIMIASDVPIFYAMKHCEKSLFSEKIRIYFCAITKKSNIKRRLIDSMEFISNKNNNIKAISFIFVVLYFEYFFSRHGTHNHRFLS